jgi:hypothetical protein
MMISDGESMGGFQRVLRQLGGSGQTGSRVAVNPQHHDKQLANIQLSTLKKHQSLLFPSKQVSLR